MACLSPLHGSLHSITCIVMYAVLSRIQAALSALWPPTPTPSLQQAQATAATAVPADTMNMLADPLGPNHPRYEKIKQLGEGANGRVFLCRDKLDKEDPLVAIKLLPRGDQINNYVLTEILNHRKLWHPHVVQCKEVFLTPHDLAIVMEYADGGDLFDHAITSRQAPLPEPDVRWFFQQLIIALDYCHRKGVANRDIKLENSLRTLPNKNVPCSILKLCDFGFSKDCQAAAAMSFVGTPAYLAPEVLACEEQRVNAQAAKTGAAAPAAPQAGVAVPTYDGPAADVWSCGVWLYTMLTRTYPFERHEDKNKGNRYYLMYQRIRQVDYRIPSNISQSCADLLSRILVKDPAQRITIQQIVTHPWFTVGLPPGALEMNQEPADPGAWGQSDDDIRRIVKQARTGPTGSAFDAMFAEAEAAEMDDEGA